MATPKKPVLAAKKGPGSDEDFVYESTLLDEDGKKITITVPSLAVMPKPNQFKLIRLQKADQSGILATDYLLENGIGRELMDLLEELPGDESNEFMEKWTEHSGLSLGESRAS